MFSVSKVGRKKRKEGRKEKKGKRKEGRKEERKERRKEGREGRKVGRKKKIDFFYRRKKELEGPGLKLSCCWLPEEGLLHPVPPTPLSQAGQGPCGWGWVGGHDSDLSQMQRWISESRGKRSVSFQRGQELRAMLLTLRARK